MSRRFVSRIEEWNGEGVLSVLGTTASGKTRTVLDYVQRAGLGQVLLVNLDSVAAYRELDIGSAKVIGSDRTNFDWVGLDLYSPAQEINAADFKSKIWGDLTLALTNKRPVVLVGGSHFYERYVVEGASAGAASDPLFQTELEKVTSENIQKDIVSIDARFAEKIKNISDRYRLARLADLVIRQKLSYEELYLLPKKDSLLSATYTYIHSSEKNLKAIHQRVDQMFRMGWVEEVKGIIGRHSANAPALKSTGYLEITEMLEKGLALDETIELVKIRHAQLAKKQRTWLRQFS